MCDLQTHIERCERSKAQGTVPDELMEWFRRIGTGLSGEDYEAGIRLLSEVEAKAKGAK